MPVDLVDDLCMAHIQDLDEQVRGFRDGLNRVANGLRDILEDIVPAIDHQSSRTLLLRQTTFLQSQIRGQLNAVGFGELIDDFISGYDESLLFGEQVLNALGRPDYHLSPLRVDTLQNLKNFDMTAFQEIGSQAVRTLSKELTLNVLAGKKRHEVVNAMNNVLTGQFAGTGSTYADTALRAFDRTANNMLWMEEAGIDKFRYFGPRDNVTRPFCLSRAGLVFTVDQIKQMNNGTSFSNVLVYMGGARCRHSWTPIVD